MTDRAILVVLMGALLALGGCEAKSSSFSDADDDSSSDTDTDTDTDSDTDSDGDSDSDSDDCTEGELFCLDGDVYECTGPDNQSELVEECPSPLVCINGMCVSDDECGEAVANKSNVGCEYFGVDMDNYTSALPYAIVVSNLDAATVHVMVEARNGMTWNLLEETDIDSKEAYVFMLGDNSTNGSFHMPNKAYRVTSDLPVVAYQFNPYAGLQPNDADICTNDGSLLIPTSGLDMYYYALTYPPNVSEGMIVIAGTEDETLVTVTAAVAINAGGSVPAIPAGGSESFMLQEADVVQLESMGDLSGSYIEADKKVAVWGGNDCAYVPTSVSWCDHLEHQMFPVTTWGQEFVAARTVIRTSMGEPENDYWRVIASEDGTSISTVPDVAGLNGQTMNAGQVIEVGVNYSFTVSATAPIMIGQFLTGHSATDVPFEGAGGDPAFALLPPYEQFMTNYVFLAPEKYLNDYLVITHPTGLTVNLDDNPVTSNPDCITAAFNDAPDWEITRCLIPDFTHTIDAAEGVGISVWGYGGRVSYGYTGGLNLETINPIIPE
jgi:hypothetical protein